MRFCSSNIKRILFYYLIFVFVLTLVLQWIYNPFIRIEAYSMLPSFHHGDYLLLNQQAYRWKEPKRGDVIIFRRNNILYVKRIIGLPGDTFKVKEYKVYIGDVLLNEPYVYKNNSLRQYMGGRAPPNFGPVTVAPHTYYVLGDNRLQSMDSRSWGPVYENELEGRVDAVWFPLERLKFIK